MRLSGAAIRAALQNAISALGDANAATDPDGNLVEFSVGQELSDFQNYIAENT